MLELTKLARWALPGAVALTWLLAGLQLQRFLSFEPNSFKAFISSGGLAIAAIASIPIGLMIYQVYSFSFARPLHVQIVHQDIGLEVLTELPRLIPLVEKSVGIGISPFRAERVDGVKFRNRTLHQRWWGRSFWLRRVDEPHNWLPFNDPQRKSMLAAYYSAREKNWVAVEWLLTATKARASVSVDRAFAELDRLSEIYHTLGATRDATVLGAGLSVFVGTALTTYHSASSVNGPGVAAGSFLTMFFMLVIVRIFHFNRGHTLDRRVAVLIVVLELLYPKQDE